MTGLTAEESSCFITGQQERKSNSYFAPRIVSHPKQYISDIELAIECECYNFVLFVLSRQAEALKADMTGMCVNVSYCTFCMVHIHLYLISLSLCNNGLWPLLQL